jgi:hypothetical protein
LKVKEYTKKNPLNRGRSFSVASINVFLLESGTDSQEFQPLKRGCTSSNGYDPKELLIDKPFRARRNREAKEKGFTKKNYR